MVASGVRFITAEDKFSHPNKSAYGRLNDPEENKHGSALLKILRRRFGCTAWGRQLPMLGELCHFVAAAAPPPALLTSPASGGRSGHFGYRHRRIPPFAVASRVSPKSPSRATACGARCDKYVEELTDCADNVAWLGLLLGNVTPHKRQNRWQLFDTSRTSESTSTLSNSLPKSSSQVECQFSESNGSAVEGECRV